eukprot:765040-Hanusia_phi.AAC.2
MLHPSVRAHVAKRFMHQNKNKLDSKCTDAQFAFNMMAKIFNDDSWTPKVRYPDDEHLMKVNPNH